MKRAELKLEMTPSTAESDGPVGNASAIREALIVQAVSECTDFPSFTKRLYPCWVISLLNLSAFDELPQHEGKHAPYHRAAYASSNIDAERPLPTAAFLFRRRRRNTKTHSRNSKSYSPTARARRAHTASSSRRIGKVDGQTPLAMGSTTYAAHPTPITSSTRRYYNCTGHINKSTIVLVIRIRIEKKTTLK